MPAQVKAYQAIALRIEILGYVRVTPYVLGKTVYQTNKGFGLFRQPTAPFQHHLILRLPFKRKVVCRHTAKS
jgi:hypothetical protein